MKKQHYSIFLSILLTLLVFVPSLVYANGKVVLLELTGPIGPASQDYVQRGLEKAIKEKATIVVLRLDTPGGLETAMRGIDKAILASPVPVVTYVAPSGARAASAGTFILYASHIAAMAPGTNVGAASPVNIGGEMSSPVSGEDKTKQPQASTLEKKATHDAAAYIRSLAELRGRNVEWAEKAVREAVSISSDEALKLKVIDITANDIPELLKNINGHVITVQGTKQVLDTSNLTIESFKPDWRFQFLSIITDPTIAYILLLVGIYGLFFEFSNPGFVLPGVAGGISLLLALYAFQLLPINYTGFALLFLGIVFMIMEAYISSFGVLGVGGIIAFATGSVLLMDTNVPGFSIAWQVILLMSIFSAVFFLVVINLVIQAMRKKITTGREALIGREGVVLEYKTDHLIVRIQGEIWNASSEKPAQVGQKIRVVKVSGLLLTVEPL